MNCYSIDLDGTLLNTAHEISDANLEAIRELKAQGHCVILNTGRAIADVIKIPAVQHLDVPIFCINGSVLFSKEGEMLYEATIGRETYQELLPLISAYQAGVLVYTNKGGIPSTLPPLQNKQADELDALFSGTDYQSFLKDEEIKIYKLIALSYHGDIQNIPLMREEISSKFNLSVASSFPNNVEITSGEAHKGKAILKYRDMMGLSFDQIIAFGDGGNDLGQFEVATISVAMANAPAAIQEQADIITRTNDEDGVAFAIRELLPHFK